MNKGNFLIYSIMIVIFMNCGPTSSDSKTKEKKE